LRARDQNERRAVPNSYTHWDRFDLPTTQFAETDHWLLAVRKRQVTLGSSVLLLKRPIPSLGSLAPDEAADLPAAVSQFEQRTRDLFAAERFNYLVAMMKDPYVHLHAFPRYSSTRMFAGHEYRDDAWPRAIELQDVETPEGAIERLRSAFAQGA
jgi:diadenosine tetraphosphate (Ap4A) HIT family hydrolase